MKTRYEKIKEKISFWENKLSELNREHSTKSIELEKYVNRHPSLSFAELQTCNCNRLQRIYEYFDKKYPIDFQGGLRCDERGMRLVFWVADDPEYLILHLTSTSENICFGGSTSWIVKAPTLKDKIQTLIAIKKDIKKIILK